MPIKKGQTPILVTNIAILFFFGMFYLSKMNYEFLIYVGVIVFFLAIILRTNDRIEYPNEALWGLTAWAILHMAGGALCVKGIRLYELILIPISSKYEVFRYDQFVHIIGFGVATYVMYCLIRPQIVPGKERGFSFYLVIVMAGLGVGAFNEIVEFMVNETVPESGVGGYINTSLDLISNLIGAVTASVLILLREKRVCSAQA